MKDLLPFERAGSRDGARSPLHGEFQLLHASIPQRETKVSMSSSGSFPASAVTSVAGCLLDVAPAASPARPSTAIAGVDSTIATAPRGVLFSNIAWMLLGNVAYGFSQWALLVALAKIGTIEMVGNFALAVAIVLPVLMFGSLSLRSIQITDYHRLYRFLEYASLRLFMLFLSLVFILAFGLIAGYSRAVLLSILLIAGGKAFEYVSDLLYGLLQQREDMAGVAISMTLRGILSVAALSLGVFLTHSLVWGSAGLLVASAAVLFGYDIPKTFADRKTRLASVIPEAVCYCRSLVTNRGNLRLWKLALTGLPMGLVLMLVSLNLNIPRYFIQRHLGIAELGIFSAIATLLAAGSVVTNAVGQAAAPRLAKYFLAKNKRGFAILLAAIVAASLGFGALGFGGALFFGRQAMAAIYRPEYSTRQDVLVWLMGASGFFYLGSTLGYAVTAVRCFAPQLPLFTVAAVTTAIGCFALVPRFGLRGAAMAILISAVIQCVGSAYLLYKSCRRPSAELATTL
jgi:O-antigen/teichoic acid export membrane protein